MSIIQSPDTFRQGQRVKFDSCPVEIRANIVELCAAERGNTAAKRQSLSGLSLMNKTLRELSLPHLFDQVILADSTDSDGKELWVSLEKMTEFFEKRPILLQRVRAVGLYPSGRKGAYYYKIAPAFVRLLRSIPNIKELCIRVRGIEAAKLLSQLEAPLRTSSRGAHITTITSLTLSARHAYNVSPSLRTESNSNYDAGFLLPLFPNLKRVCLDIHNGVFYHSHYAILEALRSFPGVTELMVVKESSRSAGIGDDIDDHTRPDFTDDGMTAAPLTFQNLTHLSMVGGLTNFRITDIAEHCQAGGFKQLKYLVVTDEQYIQSHSNRERVLGRGLNEDRNEAAMAFFFYCRSLESVTFVRRGVGQMFVPVRDESGTLLCAQMEATSTDPGRPPGDSEVVPEEWVFKLFISR